MIAEIVSLLQVFLFEGDAKSWYFAHPIYHRVTVGDVIRHYKLKAEVEDKGNRTIVVACPVHKRGKLYYPLEAGALTCCDCYTIHSTWNALSLVAAIEGCSDERALAYLAEWFPNEDDDDPSF